MEEGKQKMLDTDATLGAMMSSDKILREVGMGTLGAGLWGDIWPRLYVRMSKTCKICDMLFA